MKDLKDCKILVTPTSYGSQDPELKTELEKLVGEVVYNNTGKPLSTDQLKELLIDVDGYIAGLDEIDASVFDSAPKLKVVSRYGVGYNNVDLNAAAINGGDRYQYTRCQCHRSSGINNRADIKHAETDPPCGPADETRRLAAV